jgi:hypothetical protein
MYRYIKNYENMEICEICERVPSGIYSTMEIKKNFSGTVKLQGGSCVRC